jgi:hypothetical protein
MSIRGTQENDKSIDRSNLLPLLLAKFISHYIDEDGVTRGYAFLIDGKPCIDLSVADIACGSIFRGSDRIYGRGLKDALTRLIARHHFDCPTL